jgi:hypothetical protein
MTRLSIFIRACMTSVRGYRILTSPCCGANFAAPRYASMNYRAREYWTDGKRVRSLSPLELMEAELIDTYA